MERASDGSKEPSLSSVGDREYTLRIRDYKIKPGVWLVTGPESCGKTRFITEVRDAAYYLEIHGERLWPTSGVGRQAAMNLLVGCASARAALRLVDRHVVDETVEGFCAAYPWAIPFLSYRASSHTMISLLSERLRISLDDAEASLDELARETASPVPIADLEEERKVLRGEIQRLTSDIEDLDLAGQHDEASYAFGLRSKLQRDLRRIQGAVEKKQNSASLKDHRAALEASIEQGKMDLARCEGFIQRLNTLREKFELEFLGWSQEFTGLKPKIDTRRQIQVDPVDRILSTTERVGIEIAAALALRSMTKFPFVLIEDHCVPKKARGLFTGEIEIA